MPRQPVLAYLPDADFLNKVADFVSGYRYESGYCCGFFPSFFSSSKNSPDDCLVRELKTVLCAGNIPDGKLLMTDLTKKGREKNILTAEHKYARTLWLLTRYSEKISIELQNELKSKGILNQNGRPMQTFLDATLQGISKKYSKIITEKFTDKEWAERVATLVAARSQQYIALEDSLCDANRSSQVTPAKKSRFINGKERTRRVLYWNENTKKPLHIVDSENKEANFDTAGPGGFKLCREDYTDAQLDEKPDTQPTYNERDTFLEEEKNRVELTGEDIVSLLKTLINIQSNQDAKLFIDAYFEGLRAIGMPRLQEFFDYPERKESKNRVSCNTQESHFFEPLFMTIPDSSIEGKISNWKKRAVNFWRLKDSIARTANTENGATVATPLLVMNP